VVLVAEKKPLAHVRAPGYAPSHETLTFEMPYSPSHIDAVHYGASSPKGLISLSPVHDVTAAPHEVPRVVDMASELVRLQHAEIIRAHNSTSHTKYYTGPWIKQ